jgi:glucose dehydrogenase
MRTIRRLIKGLTILMTVWVMLSFVGVMFNPANAGVWTTSLMWSLIASVVVMPGLVVAHHANERAARKRAAESARASLESQPAFIEEADEEELLWPSSEESVSDKN